MISEKHNALPYLKLQLADDIGLTVAWRLIHHRGGADEVFLAEPEELLSVPGMTPVKLKNLFDPSLASRAEAILESVSKSNAVCLSPDCDAYPQSCKNLFDPPLALFVKGSLASRSRSLAVVGTRLASITGVKNARSFASYFAERGVIIVSGLARGIDTAAHQGTLDARGRTIAVLGSGFNSIYPQEHRAFAEHIVEAGGALVSEYPPDAATLPFQFPMRNRILCALSDAVLVVEAPKRSGALITAELAIEQGMDVFVIPGGTNVRQSEGSNELIKDGAFCCTDPKDIAERMRWADVGGAKKVKPVLQIKLSEQDRVILSALEEDQAQIVDQICFQTGLSVPKALQALVELESKGLVTQKPGNRWHLS